MKNRLWAKAIGSCADPQRVKHVLDLLSETSAEGRLDQYSAEQINLLVVLFSGSLISSNLLIANPDWLAMLDVESLRHPRRIQGFRSEIQKLIQPGSAGGREVALDRIRKFKQREMVRVAARDLGRLSNTAEITRELSDLADVCLDSVLRICWEQFAERFGMPYHQDADGNWHLTQFSILGLGKLGGQELNYSSDVDVIFVYSEEGEVFKTSPSAKTPPRSVMSNHQFFCRLGEAVIAEVTRSTDDGFLFRIDLRLRPEGDAGPLCRSLESYENYYAQWGQTWERMMLIKARGVGGHTALAAEFLEMIQPFRFPRSTGEGVLREIAATKDRIENEIVGEEELDRNVKLGRGGVREVEFVVQTLQLMHAGRQPFLQIPQTLPCLSKLAQYKLITNEQANQLADAYCFLRDVEHRLQMDENLQTHTIPSDLVARKRLSKLMGFGTLPEFENARRLHAQNVRGIYEGLFKENLNERESPFPSTFDSAEAEWKSLLAQHRFRDPDRAFAVLKEFVEGPGYVHVSPRTMELARQLLPRFLALCPTREGKDGKTRKARRGTEVQLPVSDLRVLSDPDRVATRLDSFISAYGARATLFELWNSNPAIFELLVMLFDRSEFLAEVAIRTPDLVDDLVSSGRLRQRKTAEETLEDLRHGLADEDQLAWMRRYHEVEFLRIGLRDILGLTDFEQSADELSSLADACLQYALESVMLRYRMRKPPFAVIGVGKLGGREIAYGSDLDILFVTEATSKELPELQKRAAELIEMLSRRTERGMVFVIDTRLRPDGEKGLLVNTLAAHEAYYRTRAQLWEIQTLTRTRVVAGDLEVGVQFQEMAARLSDFKSFSSVALGVQPGLRKRRPKGKNQEASGSLRPVCYTRDWKEKICEMRIRIEKERTPRGKEELAIKTGRGGLMDAEFIAQALCLEHGWQEANTLRALERGGVEGILPDADKLLTNYRQVRRLESILRRWSYEGETVLPDDPAPYYRVSVRCGFENAEAFRTALAQWRAAVRAVYERVFLG
jgi:glutamate-ammonia-ligase adenylyltransferase